MRKNSIRYHGICRDCQQVTTTTAREWFKSSPPRCIAWGGMLDKGARVCGQDFKNQELTPAFVQEFLLRTERLASKPVESLETAICLLPVVKRVGARHGLQVHWADHGKHVWINADGERVLDYWSATGRARAHGVNRQLPGVAFALDLARELNSARQSSNTQRSITNTIGTSQFERTR